MGNEYVLVNKKDDIYLLNFQGSIDSFAVTGIKTFLEEQIDDNFKYIVINLGAVQFLDSTGVGLFASLLKKTHKKEGAVFIVQAEGQVRAVLEIVGFDSLAKYTQTTQEALDIIENK